MNAYIKGMSYYLPEKIVSNSDLVEEFPEWNVEKIANKVGINQRHVSATDETSGDMAYKAALLLFEEYNLSPTNIDFILFCTQTPDYYLPTTACLLQDRLGIPTTAGALDFNLGCSGYVYGLSIAKGLIYSGMAQNILLLTSESYNKLIHPNDKGNRSLFGDGAAATLISTNNGFAEIGNFSLGTDGRGGENLIVRSGCFRQREAKNDFHHDEGGYIRSSDHLYMNGSEIFNFTLEAIPPLLQAVFSKNQIEKENVDLFVFHQANKFMLNTLRKVCNIPKDRFYIDLEKTGNTVSSTIPIAMKDAIDKGILLPNMNVLIAGFGVGYSWGGAILKY